MADVRLTAINPEDSSVVYVACNEKGELKLEEIPDQSFDGNLDGDLTVSGSATFAGGQLSIYGSGAIGNPQDDDSGYLSTNFVTTFRGDGAQVWRGGPAFNTWTSEIYADGSATFASKHINLGNSSDPYINVGTYVRRGMFDARGPRGSASSSGAFVCSVADDANGTNAETTFIVWGDGSATFASRKAGFTKEGYLWCTTRRGDTVILDATSNGLASWVEYTPPARRSEKNVVRPKPEESSQDGPETRQ